MMSSGNLKMGTEQATGGNRLFQNVDEVTSEFVALVAAFDEEEINRSPFEGSWTVAQVAEHVRKSNNGIAQSLQMPGRAGERTGDERVNELKDVFMDFGVKLKSPAFIVPAQVVYNREELLERLRRSIERIKQERARVDLSEIIDLSVLGTISKLELLHFVVFHTQRHIHQLKNIYQTIKTKTNVTDQSLSQLRRNNGGSV